MFKNKLSAIIVSLILFVGSVLILNAISPNDQNNIWSTGTTAIGITLTTGGDLVGNTNNILDLGTSTYEWKNGYFDGTLTTDVLTVDESATIATTLVVTGDVTASADLRSTSFLGNSAITTLASINTTLPVTGTFCRLISTEACTLIGRPVIATSGASIGDYLVLTTTQTDAITFTEGDVHDLQLGDTTRVVGQYDTLFLVLDSSDTSDSGASFWREISFIAN